MNKLKEKGITLVALVATIIILLILAGVTISQIGGNNGLFSKVRQAVGKYKNASLDEELAIGEIERYLEGFNITEKEEGVLIDITKVKITTLQRTIKVEIEVTGEVSRVAYKLNTEEEWKQNEEDEKSLTYTFEELSIGSYYVKVRAYDKNGKYVEAESEIITIGETTTAQENDVLEGKTYIAGDGNIKTGNMINYGTVKEEIEAGESYEIKEGYYAGGTITAKKDAYSDSTIEIVKPNETIEKYIDIGESFKVQFEKETEGINNTNLIFTNINEALVNIKDGIITGLAIGDTTITVTGDIYYKATINLHIFDPTTIGAPRRIWNYGKIVVDYKDTENNSSTGKYRLFYQDKNYTYIISDNLVETGGALSVLYEKANKTSGNDVSAIGQKLNPMLKDKNYTFFSLDNKYSNIKGTAYLTDPEYWKKYKNSDAEYAIGSPTAELFLNSYNTMFNKIGKIGCTITTTGYQLTNNANYLQKSQREGIYYKGTNRNWWVASPTNYANDGTKVLVVEEGYSQFNPSFSVGYDLTSRPLVCLKTSTFNSKYGNNLRWNEQL